MELWHTPTLKLIPVGLDLGSSQTKCVALARKSCFASAINTQRPNQWNGNSGSKGKVSVGDDAISASKVYGSDTVFPIALGRPVDDLGYVELAKHALHKIGLAEHDWDNTCLVMGIPYEAVQKRDEIRDLLKSELHVKKCMVETQARGTLRTMNSMTAVIINIGFGTTEAVIFDQGQVAEGESLHVGVHTILDGLVADRLDVEKISFTDISMYDKYQKESRVHATTVADVIHRWYKEKMLSAKHEYELILSGGGIQNNAIKNALRKTRMQFRIPDNPTYSNAHGHYLRAMMNC